MAKLCLRGWRLYGEKLTTTLARHGKWQIEIVKRSDRSTGFSLLPRCWVVERTFAWLNRNVGSLRDFEAKVGSSEAWIYLASVQLLDRRLARITTTSVPLQLSTTVPIPSQALSPRSYFRVRFSPCRFLTFF